MSSLTLQKEVCDGCGRESEPRWGYEQLYRLIRLEGWSLILDFESRLKGEVTCERRQLRLCPECLRDLPNPWPKFFVEPLRCENCGELFGAGFGETKAEAIKCRVNVLNRQKAYVAVESDGLYIHRCRYCARKEESSGEEGQAGEAAGEEGEAEVDAGRRDGGENQEAGA
jgi:hypothetical protein